jgi:hypothetical protein
MLVHPHGIEGNGDHERYRIGGLGAGPCYKPPLCASNTRLDQVQLGTHPTCHRERGADADRGRIPDKLDAWRSGGDAGDQIGRARTGGRRAQLKARPRNRRLR